MGDLRANAILAKMRAGEKAYGCSLNFPSAAAIEILGAAGLDYVWLDSEHGPFTPESIEEMCRTAELAGLTPIARVPDISAPTILRFLDRGVMGIIGPHVSTHQQAQGLADACRFPPQGKRSFGYGLRGVPPSVSSAEYIAQANAEVLVIAMIEDVEAIKNLPQILSVKGIDLFMYGPNDLAGSMGHPGQPDHPEVQKAMTDTTERIHAAGRRVTGDVMPAASATGLLLEGAREFLRKAKAS